MIVMTVLAVINELSLILYEMYAENPGQNPIATALLFMFSLGSVTGLMKIVVLRTVLAYLVTTALLILQIVWQHSRDFKKWNHG